MLPSRSVGVAASAQPLSMPTIAAVEDFLMNERRESELFILLIALISYAWLMARIWLNLKGIQAKTGYMAVRDSQETPIELTPQRIGVQ